MIHNIISFYRQNSGQGPRLVYAKFLPAILQSPPTRFSGSVLASVVNVESSPLIGWLELGIYRAS